MYAKVDDVTVMLSVDVHVVDSIKMMLCTDDARVEGEMPFGLHATAQDSCNRGLVPIARNFRQKPHASEVHADNRDPQRTREVRSLQQRAVATE